MAQAEKKVTFENVAAAAEALIAEGSRASVRKITAKLGGGSPNSISDFLNQWKGGRPVVKAVDIQIDPRINAIIGEQISSAIAVASASALADKAEAEETLDMIKFSAKETQSLADSLAADLQTATVQVQTMSGQIEQLKADAERVKADAAAAVDKANAALAVERQAAETARVELAKAELRLEAFPRIEAEIKQVRAELAAERQAAAKELATARSLSAELHELAAVAQAKLESEVVLRKSVSAQLLEVTQAGQARLEAAAREITVAQDAATKANIAAKKSGEEAAELRGQLTAAAKKPGSTA
jgi:colicin import membrane protein